MDRKLMKQKFTENSSPDWVCPSCEKGILRIKKGSFAKAETTTSKANRHHNDWEPDWIRSVYICMLVCTNDKCKETVSSCGSGFVDWDVVEDQHGQPDADLFEFFQPSCFEPHLRIIKIPDECPATVGLALAESFRLFFSSPSAAANSVRIAIEEMLTDLGVKRFDTVKNKRRYIALHKRIGLLPAKYAKHKSMLLAIKWLGNAGSHNVSDLTKDDVLDAYELTEHLLEEIYSPKAKKLSALAKKVNKKKGPVS